MSAITGAGFQAFSAATQGDWMRAAEAAADVPVEEWPAFVAAVVGLAGIARTQVDARQPRRHRVCDNCLKANHDRCAGGTCGCTSADCPA